ncbi:NRDE family protein [Echinicola jeungdonensis]|uniref:NRDE family protein n=1 Tax=Echinicola jeungdonensis TaxID=709343 RepID=A0ABV5J7P5_9BACT|nr:NRDE family protein [Echinicola jeungdonensis]MDN3669687.1 NRDE family protein [Echinicola jeungdonensis]
MCLITFNWKGFPGYKLILVANRDEFFERPTQGLHQWPAGFFAGKDLKNGGTWMGFHPSGRFAAITNFRDLDHLKSNPISRGNLVKDFLEKEVDPLAYLKEVEKFQDRFDGFNLLVGSGEHLFYMSNYKKGIEEVKPGIHGLSNALLDDPWPKVKKAKSDLAHISSKGEFTLNQLMAIHQSEKKEPFELLPYTGIPKEMEQALSARFIRYGGEYGTVNISVLCWKENGEVILLEKNTRPDAPENAFQQVELKVGQAIGNYRG